VTMLDGASHARATYVIWPDNLSDNASLHDCYRYHNTCMSI
jgi:hypothetical protein